jgi:hypothetical protein
MKERLNRARLQQPVRPNRTTNVRVVRCRIMATQEHPPFTLEVKQSWQISRTSHRTNGNCFWKT